MRKDRRRPGFSEAGQDRAQGPKGLMNADPVDAAGGTARTQRVTCGSVPTVREGGGGREMRKVENLAPGPGKYDRALGRHDTRRERTMGQLTDPCSRAPLSQPGGRSPPMDDDLPADARRNSVLHLCAPH